MSVLALTHPFNWKNLPKELPLGKEEVIFSTRSLGFVFINNKLSHSK